MKREPWLLMGTIVGATVGIVIAPVRFGSYSPNLFADYFYVWSALAGLMVGLVIEISIRIFRK